MSGRSGRSPQIQLLAETERFCRRHQKELRSVSRMGCHDMTKVARFNPSDLSFCPSRIRKRKETGGLPPIPPPADHASLE